MIRRAVVLAGATLLLFATSAWAQTEHEHHPAAVDAASTPPAGFGVSPHVPPDPPAQPMEPMSGKQMIEVMEMDDAARYGVVTIDELEWQERNDALAWDAGAWYGGDYDKLRLRTEGERAHDRTEDASIEAFWDHVAARWWSILTGVRHDFDSSATRTWAAFGIEGIAPQWFDVEATVYVGDQGRTALRAHVRYEVLLTQKLILQPEVEANLYGKDDPARGIGSGLSDIEVGLRLRYEIRREFAPYIGVEWRGLFGDTADFARSEGDDPRDTQFVAGFRIWF